MKFYNFYFFYRVKITTVNDDVIYGVIHSHNSRKNITLIETPPPNSKNSSSSSPSSSRSQSPHNKIDLTNDVNFIAINEFFVKSIDTLSKPKHQQKLSINDTFANALNAPSEIPNDRIAETIRENGKIIQDQEKEFKLRKLSQHFSKNGALLLKNLSLTYPIDSIDYDDKKNIILKDTNIKIFKPYKADDAKIESGDGSNEEKEKLTTVKKIIEKTWEKIESTEKGG